MFAEPGKLVFIRRSGLHQQALGWGNRCRSGDIGWQHQIAGAMMRQHIAQHTVDFMAGVAGGQQRTATGDLLAHAGEMAKIAIAEGMVQQFAALLGAGRGRTDDMQYRNMFRIATRNAVQRAQFADAVSGQQRTGSFDARIAVSGICRIQLVGAADPPQGAVRDDAIEKL